jgi:hypothetical protein
MIDIALDQITNDLIINNMDFVLYDDTKQIMQHLSIRLKFILGEWFLDIFAGVPYFEYFFIKNPNQIQIESILKEEIVTTRGIVQLLSWEADLDKKNRLYKVKFSARSITNETLMKELELPV